MVYSRAFEDHDEVDGTKLIPLLDMTQHSYDMANINHETDASGNVVVTALSKLGEGEELFNEYHDALEDHEFALYYGFVPGETDTIQTLLEEKSPIFFPDDSALI